MLPACKVYDSVRKDHGYDKRKFKTEDDSQLLAFHGETF